MPDTITRPIPRSAAPVIRKLREAKVKLRPFNKWVRSDTSPWLHVDSRDHTRCPIHLLGNDVISKAEWAFAAWWDEQTSARAAIKAIEEFDCD